MTTRLTIWYHDVTVLYCVSVVVTKLVLSIENKAMARDLSIPARNVVATTLTLPPPPTNTIELHRCTHPCFRVYKPSFRWAEGVVATRILIYIAALFLVVLTGWVVTTIVTSYNLVKNAVASGGIELAEAVPDIYPVFTTVVSGVVAVIVILMLIHIAKSIRASV